MKKIAVVEDNEDNRVLVREFLGGRYELVEYGAAEEALLGLREDKPDLVLVDIALPGIDGIDLLRCVRNDPATTGIPMVALTAHAMAGDRERYLEEGFNAYLSKPITDEEWLVSEIERVLREDRRR